MKTYMRTLLLLGCGAVALVLSLGAGRISAKEKSGANNGNDPTSHLYALLDSKFGGKLDDFCMLADVFNDPKNPGQPQQHVLRIEYSKDRAFGKLRIYVRTVAQLSADQLKAYTPKQTYDFAVVESAKYTKTDPGPFGKAGDLYFLPTSDGGPLGTSPITPEAQSQYDQFVTQYIIPALDKKAAEGGS